MKRSRFSEHQIVRILKEVEGGRTVQEVCREYGFSEWASVFAWDEVLTAAILDRLLHHGTVINIRGKSYRLRDKIQAGTVAAAPPLSPSPPSKGCKQEQ